MFQQEWYRHRVLPISVPCKNSELDQLAFDDYVQAQMEEIAESEKKSLANIDRERKEFEDYVNARMADLEEQKNRVSQFAEILTEHAKDIGYSRFARTGWSYVKDAETQTEAVEEVNKDACLEDFETIEFDYDPWAEV